MAGTEEPGLPVDGKGEQARFGQELDLAVDASGSLFVADHDNACIRKVSPQGEVSTFVPWGSPMYLAFSASGDLYVEGERTIGRVSPAGKVTTILGSAQNSWVPFPPRTGMEPEGPLVVDPAGDALILGFDGKLRKVTPSGDESVFESFLTSETAGGYGANSMAIGLDGAVYVSVRQPGGCFLGSCIFGDTARIILDRVGPSGGKPQVVGDYGVGFADGDAKNAQFVAITDLAVDAQGNIFVADAGNLRIRRIALSGQVSTVAGNGTFGHVDGSAQQAELEDGRKIAIDSCGDVYFTEFAQIREAVHPGCG